MRVQAAVLERYGTAPRWRELELAGPGPAQVLVRIRATGVCASDVHVVDGRLPKPLPVVPGHEAAGEVVALGDGVDHVGVGDHVVLSILPRCGRCTACGAGRGNHCAWAGELAATGTIDGARTAWHLDDGTPVHHFTGVSSFADHVVAPASGVIPVDPALGWSVAALLGCAVTTGLGAVRNAARVRSGQTVAVIGCGGVGLNVVQGARLAGASRIVAVDLDPGSLELAARLGASDLVDARDGDPAAAVLAAVPGGVDHAFDAVGRPAALRAAFAALAPGGTAVAVGLYGVDDEVTLPAFPLVGERRLVGTYLGGGDPREEVPALAAEVLAGTLRLEEQIVERPAGELASALDELRAGTTLARQVLTF